MNNGLNQGSVISMRAVDQKQDYQLESPNDQLSWKSDPALDGPAVPSPAAMALSPARFNTVLPRSLAAIFTHVRTCMLRLYRPCYERDRPGYEHHAPVMGITSLLQVSRRVTSLWRVGTTNNTHAEHFILWLSERRKVHKHDYQTSLGYEASIERC